MKYRKMTFISVLSKFLGCLFLCIVFLISCDNDEKEDFQLSRLFSPTSFKASIDFNVVDFSWVPINGATYVLEISKDSLLFEQDLQTIYLDEKAEYHLEDLWSSTRYSARIKALSTNSSIADSKFSSITFTTGVENIFYAVSPEDVDIDKIILHWDNTRQVSTIVLSQTGVENIVIPLSDTEINEGKKTIENLSGNSTYTFRIYLGEMLRGTLTVNTLAFKK